MTGWSLIIAAGAVNWIATTIICESELTRPLRELVKRKRERPVLPNAPVGVDAEGVRWVQVGLDRFERLDRQPWRTLDYFLSCHLCVGVWVAIGEVLWLGPLVGRGAAGYVFTALLVKAIGHLVLELRPQAWRSSS